MASEAATSDEAAAHVATTDRAPPGTAAASAAATEDRAVGPTGQAERPAPLILIVDDHEDNVEVLRARLEAWGYRTEAAADGEQALATIRTARPDLVLLDVMMPKLDGCEVTRRIKQDEELRFIPVIMQTALDSTEQKVQGLEAGADDYITKPIEFAELKARLNAQLRLKSLQDELKELARQLQEANAQLSRMARVDGLTGVANRRHLQERLDEMFEHSKRLNEPLSVVMCDIDKFKSVNDTYGHQAGDAVLVQFAQLLEGAAREVDRVGRYGGEEFLLILPGTVLDAAVTFAERVRKEVEANVFTFEGGTLRRTASFGVAGWPHPRIANCDSLVKAADDALYVAKETGRNRVIRFDGEEFNAHLQAIAQATDAPSAPGPEDAADREVPRAQWRDQRPEGEDRRAPA